MESNYNRDFEQHVKQNADQYRMFPSEKVWKGVHNALHTRKKWYGLGLAFLLLMTGGAVTWVMTIYPASKKPNDVSAIVPAPAQSLFGKSSPESVTIADAKNLIPFDDRADRIETISRSEMPFGGLSRPGDVFITNGIEALHQDDISKDIRATSEPVNLTHDRPEFALLPGQGPNNSFFNVHSIAAFDNSVKMPESAEETLAKAEVSAVEAVYIPEVIPTIESASNPYKFKLPRKRLSWQIFITPTVSYRKLSVNKSFEQVASVSYPFASLTDVNQAVVHKPDVGLQLGVTAGYSLTRNLKLTGGVQLNVNRYDIKAFVYNGEVATVNLNGGSDNTSVSAWTYYRNYNGYKSDWLKNYYVSVSVPIGAELKLFGGKKTHVGVAGTIQPTYILSDRAYMISTDYKNYAKIPWLIRHVNVSSSFETFINYSSGKTRWQIGPQVRYQMLSSFQNKYPVKENLFDVGVKVGVFLNQ